jgi:hypothetical protein
MGRAPLTKRPITAPNAAGTREAVSSVTAYRRLSSFQSEFSQKINPKPRKISLNGTTSKSGEPLKIATTKRKRPMVMQSVANR